MVENDLSLSDWATMVFTCLGVPAIIGAWLFVRFKHKIAFENRQREFQEKASKLYFDQRFERRRMIAELLKEGADWDQIAYVLNSAEFRNWEGHPFTDEMVKSEHAEMLSKKYVR